MERKQPSRRDFAPHPKKKWCSDHPGQSTPRPIASQRTLRQTGRRPRTRRSKTCARRTPRGTGCACPPTAAPTRFPATSCRGVPCTRPAVVGGGWLSRGGGGTDTETHRATDHSRRGKMDDKQPKPQVSSSQASAPANKAQPPRLPGKRIGRRKKRAGWAPPPPQGRGGARTMPGLISSVMATRMGLLAAGVEAIVWQTRSATRGMDVFRPDHHDGRETAIHLHLARPDRVLNSGPKPRVPMFECTVGTVCIWRDFTRVTACQRIGWPSCRATFRPARSPAPRRLQPSVWPSGPLRKSVQPHLSFRRSSPSPTPRVGGARCTPGRVQCPADPTIAPPLLCVSPHA